MLPSAACLEAPRALASTRPVLGSILVWINPWPAARSSLSIRFGSIPAMSTPLQSCLALKLVPALARLVRFCNGGSRAAPALKVTAAAENKAVRNWFFVTLNSP